MAWLWKFRPWAKQLLVLKSEMIPSASLHHCTNKEPSRSEKTLWSKINNNLHNHSFLGLGGLCVATLSLIIGSGGWWTVPFPTITVTWEWGVVGLSGHCWTRLSGAGPAVQPPGPAGLASLSAQPRKGKNLIGTLGKIKGYKPQRNGIPKVGHTGFNLQS